MALSPFSRRLGLAALPLALGLMMSAPAGAQNAPPPLAAAVATPDPTAAAQLLGPIHKDEAAGFRMAPPAGSRMISRSGVDLVGFAVDSKGWGGNLRLTSLDKKQPVEDFVKDILAAMSRDFKGVQIESSPTLFAGRKAVRFNVSMQTETAGAVPAAIPPSARGPGPAAPQQVTLFLQEIVIQLQDDKFLLLSLFAPLKDREPAVRTFDAMVGSLEIFKPEDVLKRRTAAAQAGKAWLAKRSAEELQSRLLPQPQWFRMIVSGADVGCVQFVEGARETNKSGQLVDVQRDGRKGIIVALNSWSFPAAGTVVTAQSVAFWAFSRDANNVPRAPFSDWVNSALTQSADPSKPGPAGAAQAHWFSETGFIQVEGNTLTDDQIAELQRQREEMIRRNPDKPPPPEIDVSGRQYHLKVALDGDPMQAETLAKAQHGVDVNVPREAAAPLPKILEYTWPRLVDLTKPGEMSFTVYNSNAQKLALRTLIVVGKDRITIDGKPTDCFKCIDELDPGSTTLWVDASGRTLLMRTSDQTILSPTSQQDMEKRWSGRLTKAGN